MSDDDDYEGEIERCPHGKKYDVEHCAKCEESTEKLGPGEHFASCDNCGKPYTCDRKSTRCCNNCRHATYHVNAQWFGNHQDWAKTHPKEYASIRRQLGK